MQLLDVRIKSEEDLTQLFGAPVLGQIPAFSEEKKTKGPASDTPEAEKPAERPS